MWLLICREYFTSCLIKQCQLRGFIIKSKKASCKGLQSLWALLASGEHLWYYKGFTGSLGQHIELGVRSDSVRVYFVGKITVAQSVTLLGLFRKTHLGCAEKTWKLPNLAGCQIKKFLRCKLVWANLCSLPPPINSKSHTKQLFFKTWL